MPSWSPHSIPQQKGKTAIVTGANVGLGFETAKKLADLGFTVIMACRNRKKAKAAKEKIVYKQPQARLQIKIIDLSNLKSVRNFAEKFKADYKKLDLLINNAGLMMPPYQKTEDGFEQQLGVNYLSHFLLTGLLLEELSAAGNSRVINLSSLAHTWGDIYFEDLQFEKKYDKQKAYGQSKLACLLFSYELQRRLAKTDKNILSLAAHPGLSKTNLMQHLPEYLLFFSPLYLPLLAQSAEKGAQPTLRAALDKHLQGGEYVGPSGWKEYKGEPILVDSSPASKDLEKAEKLWKISEKLTGISYL